MGDNAVVHVNPVQELINPLEVISRSRESSYKTIKKHFGDYLIHRLEGKVDGSGFTIIRI